MLEMGLDQSATNPTLIYPRGLDFLEPSIISKSSFLVVDDTVFSGRTLGITKNKLERLNAKTVQLAALFDFSYLYSPTEVNSDILKATDILLKLPIGSKSLSPQEVLGYLQEAVLSERMPATCDHLLFEAQARKEQFEELMELLSSTGRFLHYGRRGSHLTGALLLDDGPAGLWATPPKVRFWFHETKETLRIAPIAYRPSSLDTSSQLADEIRDAFRNAKSSESALDLLESNSLADRMFLMRHLMADLSQAGIRLQLQSKHLFRYYPQPVGGRIVDILNRHFSKLDPAPIEALETSESKIVNYMPVVPLVLSALRDAFEGQKTEGKKRKDFESRGLTVSELIDHFSSSFSKPAIHAAIDYCYDTILLASFNRDTNGRLERSARTTEINSQQHYLPAEVFGAAIIYGDTQKQYPVWIPNKVYSILERGLGIKLESLTATRDFFGDRTSIAVSEYSEQMWSSFHSDLWLTPAHKETDTEESINLAQLDDKAAEARTIINTDQRLAQFQVRIDAVHHLARQGGYDATVLANILGDGYGGTTFIAFNLSNILELSIGLLVNKSLDGLKDYENHIKGVTKKLKVLRESDELLAKLGRRATQLRYQTGVVAQQFVGGLQPIPSPNLIYTSFQQIYDDVITMHAHLREGRMPEAIQKFQTFGLSSTFDAPMHPKRFVRIGNEHIMNWLFALAGKPRPTYLPHVLTDSNREVVSTILAYDLRGIRRGLPERFNIPLEEVNRNIHGLIGNWVIANGGKLSHANMNQGDRRYAMFDNEANAIRAARWIAYHIKALRTVNHSFAVDSHLVGIGLGKGFVKSDGHGGEEAEVLDRMGHQSKKVQVDRLADEIAGKDGRDPIWILDPDEFTHAQTHGLVLASTERIDGSPIACLKGDLSANTIPWVH
jgi:hypothetical protein